MEATAAAPDPNVHPNGLVSAGFGVRAGAQLIDLALHYVVWFATAFVFLFAMALAGQDSIVEAASKTSWFGYVASGLGAVLYHTAAEGLNGATVGKRILGLVVVRESGGRCTLGAAFGRSLAFYVDSFFFGLIAYSAMEPPYQQRFGDKWAHTYVVRRSSIPKEQQQAGVHFADALVVALLLDAGCYLASTMIKAY